MSILKVARLGHPVLRTPTRRLEAAEIASPVIQQLIDDMFETMHEYQGIGLAAPQVHQGLRLFVAGVDDPDSGVSPVVMVNPEIEPLGQTTEDDWEGCLSIPEIRGRVPRSVDIRVRSLDRQGKVQSMTASGFAALVLALDDLAGWRLDKRQLSMLARLGSGSASRSVYDGFVEWHAGMKDDGTDSFAFPLNEQWPEFRIGILELSDARKPVGSRDGMNRTVETSALYNSWPQQAFSDIEIIRDSIEAFDFSMLGKIAEHNALSMHATMMSAWPPLIYLQPKTIEQGIKSK